MFSDLIESETIFKEAFEKEKNEKVEYFKRSATLQEEFIKKNGIDNAYIYYNIGNSWFLSGEIGKAILNYKKAEIRMPSNNSIKDNLNYARSNVINNVPVKVQNPILRTLFFIHYDLPFKNRAIIFITFTFILSFCGIYLLFFYNKIIKNILIVSSIVTLLILISMTIDMVQKDEGVIVVKEIIARKGDSNGYENSFNSPLYEGLEFFVLSVRSGWYEIELHDGRICWIPEYSAELIE